MVFLTPRWYFSHFLGEKQAQLRPVDTFSKLSRRDQMFQGQPLDKGQRTKDRVKPKPPRRCDQANRLWRAPRDVRERPRTPLQL